jgi:hypothetical protein
LAAYGHVAGSNRQGQLSHILSLCQAASDGAHPTRNSFPSIILIPPSLVFSDSLTSLHSIALNACEQPIHNLYFHAFRIPLGVPASNRETIR